VSRLSEYAAACSAAYYQVSTELVASKNVEMERAKSELEEHRFVCAWPNSRVTAKYLEKPKECE
jgi:hypothetical protein